MFTNPVKIISCYRAEHIEKSFSELEDLISKGYYAAGFLSYEAGFLFEDKLKRFFKKDDLYPLLWFGIYRRPAIFTHRERLDLVSHEASPYSVSNIRANISKERYLCDIKRIKEFIRRGETYQVNYTFKYKFDFKGSVFGLYSDLEEKQSVSYSALIKTQKFSILSLSPELFFRKHKNNIQVRPMKGTLERGRSAEEDSDHMRKLQESLKNRSENVMIVDLLRNDIGKISLSGTVKTEELFKVERYETLLQMISIVRSRLKKDVALYDLFKAIFPSGSVTGAPKISTMEIINSLEKEPRRVYTGCIGFFTPQKDAVFNVAIRTILINNRTKKGEMGIGSGIVYDADPYKEFEECRLKANFLTQKKREFRLIETMLWRPKKGYFLLKYHLDRLSSSAKYFDFKYSREDALKKLNILERRFKNSHMYRIRLLLDRRGNIEASFSIVDEGTGDKKVRFSERKVKSSDIFLYHKTTDRYLYDKEYEKWREKGYFDIVFTNEKNQVTEGAISNIIIKKGRFYYTPPVDCGLLNGVFRRALFDRRAFPLREKVLYRKDLRSSDKIYMVNSVRGMTEVSLG